MIEELGERPTEAQIAKKMEMPVDKVQEAMDADRRKTTISLDQIIYQDDEEFSNWSDKIADVSYTNVQSIWEDRMLLTESLEKIEPELKDIVHMVYFKDMSQTEIANKMGISQMQVSRKLKKALGLLHDFIQDQQKV